MTKLKTACPLLLGDPITTLPATTTAAAVAATTWLDECGRRVLPWWGRGGCPGCLGPAAPAHHPELRLGVFLPELPQAHVPNTARPTLSGNKRVAPTGPFVFGGHVSARARDAPALRPRLRKEPSGVRGRCNLQSHLESRLPQQLRPPAHAVFYVFVCGLTC